MYPVTVKNELRSGGTMESMVVVFCERKGALEYGDGWLITDFLICLLSATQ
jgi:hypothetical protein